MRDHPCQPLTGYGSIDDAERIARASAFRALMAGRRTVRDFSDRPVPRAVVEQAILTAGSAPSGANHQPWFFSVIESADARARIRAAAEAEEREFYATKAPQEWLDALAPLGTDPDKGFLETAPVLIAIFGQKRGGRHHHAGCAKAALGAQVLVERTLQPAHAATFGQALDGLDGPVLDTDGQRDAGQARCAVHQHGAGAAFAAIAALLGADQAQLVAQHLDQQRVFPRGNGVLAAVDV